MIPKLPSVNSKATEPEPPVKVARERRKVSAPGSTSILAIMLSLISRADSQDTTRPARIWPSSMRLATSRMPLSTPRQALERS